MSSGTWLEMKSKRPSMRSTCRAERLPAWAPPAVQEAVRSPGRPMEPATRALMEARFGHDFEHVRVHADNRAAESARVLGAEAYTAGRHVVFGGGRYAPGSDAGRRLMAHELAHVVQQSAAQHTDGISSRGDAGERGAERAAAAVSTGGAAPIQVPSSVPAIQRQDAFTTARPDYRLHLDPTLFPLAQLPTLTLPTLGSGGAAGGLRQRTLLPLPSLTFPRPRLASLATAPLPPSLALSLSGTPGSTTLPQLSRLFQVPPVPAQPSGQASPFLGLRGETTTDIGADVSLAGTPAFEMSIAMVLQADAANLAGGRIDILHQPTATGVLGISLDPRAAGTAPAYIAGQLSVTLVNLHLAQLGNRDLLELGLGQVALGVQGGQFQGQAAAQAELHLTRRFSLLVTGGVTLAPGPNGVTASPGPFNVGVVWHGP